MRTLNINIFGAPHSGKSTFCAKLFSEMKLQNFDVEYLPEAVKLDAYANPHLLNRTHYSLFLNAHKTEQYQGYTQFLINEANPITSAFYSPSVKHLSYNIFSLYDNVNFLLKPIPFKNETKGRVQKDFEECLRIYGDILYTLRFFKIPFKEVNSISQVIDSIVSYQ